MGRSSHNRRHRPGAGVTSILAAAMIAGIAASGATTGKRTTGNGVPYRTAGVLAASAARHPPSLAVAKGYDVTHGPAASFLRTNYATGDESAPYSVAIGDLNSDGGPDLVSADFLRDAVSVFLNKGDGSFRARRDYPTGRNPISVAIADLNGDSMLDLVTVGRSATMSTLLNRGGGSFEPRRDYPTGLRPQWPESLAVGDLTGDGKPEVVTANAYLSDPRNRNPGTVSVFVNNGDGTFRAKLDRKTGKFPTSVAIRDLNGDGKNDLVTANVDANTASVLINKGDGSFQARHDYPTGPLPRSLAVGDLNGDARPDLVIASTRTFRVSILLNKGDGGFGSPRRYRSAPEPEAIVVGDLNGDGQPDLATANGCRSTVSVMKNRGGGRFEQTVDYKPGTCPPSLTLGDVNRDGKADLVTANFGSDSISVLTNRPGLCTVQPVVRMRLAAAKQAILRANCKVGTIRRAYSQFGAKGSVVAQKPRFGATLPKGGKVDLVVSRSRH
jgi:hypothetical protein